MISLLLKLSYINKGFFHRLCIAPSERIFYHKENSAVCTKMVSHFSYILPYRLQKKKFTIANLFKENPEQFAEF